MKKNHEIRISLTKEELESITRKAKRLHMKPSQFLKLLGMNSNLTVTSSD